METETICCLIFSLRKGFSTKQHLKSPLSVGSLIFISTVFPSLQRPHFSGFERPLISEDVRLCFENENVFLKIFLYFVRESPKNLYIFLKLAFSFTK